MFFYFRCLLFQVHYRQEVLFYCGHPLSVPVYYNVHHHPTCSWDALQMLSKGTYSTHFTLTTVGWLSRKGYCFCCTCAELAERRPLL